MSRNIRALKDLPFHTLQAKNTAQVARCKKPNFCDFDIYRKIREPTKFRKNGYLTSIKTDISEVQTPKEKSTIINQQNAYTNCHLRIDNCFKTMKLLHFSNFILLSSGHESIM